MHANGAKRTHLSMLAALAPQWLDAFDSAAHDLKRQLLQTLVTDWLASIKSAQPFIHQPSGLLLPHAALLELLQAAANSAARAPRAPRPWRSPP